MGEMKSRRRDPIVYIQIGLLLAQIVILLFLGYQSLLLRRQVDLVANEAESLGTQTELLKTQMERTRAETRVLRFQELVFRHMDLREDAAMTAAFLLDKTRTPEEKYQAINNPYDEESVTLNARAFAIWDFYELLSLLYYERQIDKELAFMHFHRKCVHRFLLAREFIDVLRQRTGPTYSGWEQLAKEFYDAAPQEYPGVTWNPSSPR